MKKQNLSIELRKFIFMTEMEYIKHFGENYEEAVQEHMSNDKPVLRIHNINGCTSAIPIERAKYMLEKYIKLTKRPSEKSKKEAVQQKSETPVPDPGESKRIKKRRNSSQSPEYV